MPNATIQCRYQYFQTTLQLNFNQNCYKITGNVADGYVFTCERPFLLIGWTLQDGVVPNGSAGSVSMSPADLLELQSINYQQIAQNMAEANLSENLTNQSGFLSYAPTDNKPDYSYYMRKFLYGDLKTRNLYNFLTAFMMVQQYWTFENQFSADANYDRQSYTSRFMTFMQNLFKDSDKKLWLPPGTYTIAGNTAGNTDAYWLGLSAQWGNATADKKYVWVLELQNTNGF